MKIFGLFRRREWPNLDASFANYDYGTQSALQKMDIYLPSNKGDVNVVLNIHGGGWSTGDKAYDANLCRQAAKLGYVAASMNYRMIRPFPYLPLWLQPVNYKDMLDDIGSAIASLKAKLFEEGYTTKKLAITGWSAGGHLTLLYGYSRYQQSSTPIAFLDAYCSPTNFLDTEYINIRDKAAFALLSALAGKKIIYQDVLNRSPVLRDMSPLYSVIPGAPPTLMRYGAQDKWIPLSHGTAIKDALDVANVRNDLFIYPNSGHELDNTSDAEVYESYVAKLQEYLSAYFS